MDKVRLKDVSERGSSNLAQKDIDGMDGNYPIYGAAGYIGNVDFYHQEEDYIAVVKDGAGIGRTMFLPAKSSVIGTLQYIIPKKNIIPKYLYYAVKNMKLEKYYTGATIPHIYYKDYKEESFRLPTTLQQQKVVSVLEKVEKIIGEEQQELLELKKLIKSRFFEMFGDPEANPKGWKQVKLGDVCSSIVRGPFGSALKKEFFVEPNDTTYKVYEQKHAIQKSATIGTYYITEEKYQELKRFECAPGDILMSCSGTMGELYQLPNECEHGIINQALCKFTLNGKILSTYFLMYMKQTVGNLETKGSGIKNIAAVSYIKQMPLNLPPLDAQKKFEDFVYQVDELKSVKQKSLNETQLLFDSLMQKYFG